MHFTQKRLLVSSDIYHSPSLCNHQFLLSTILWGDVLIATNRKPLSSRISPSTFSHPYFWSQVIFVHRCSISAIVQTLPSRCPIDGEVAISWCVFCSLIFWTQSVKGPSSHIFWPWHSGAYRAGAAFCSFRAVMEASPRQGHACSLTPAVLKLSRGLRTTVGACRGRGMIVTRLLGSRHFWA